MWATGTGGSLTDPETLFLQDSSRIFSKASGYKYRTQTTSICLPKCLFHLHDGEPVAYGCTERHYGCDSFSQNHIELSDA